jgi:hypothetical protein
MRRHQVKRERPSLKTAHEFFSTGSFSVDPNRHYLSGEKRESEINHISEELLQLSKRQFPRTHILEYAILKSHLIVEHALVQYIRSFSAVAVDAKQVRFTFSQKLEIAYLLGFGANDPILLPTVEALNKVRNQVAHSFSLDRNAVDEMLRINSDDYDEFKPQNDRERIRGLRLICSYICGRTAGEIEGAYAMAMFDEHKHKRRSSPDGAQQA